MIAAILLAAGASRRFGEKDKLLAPLLGRPLVLHAAETITALAPRWRIAACAEESEVAALLAAQGFDIVTVNGTAMSQSLACGIVKARERGAAAALVCLADMPFITTAHLQALLDHREAAGTPVIASSRDGITMPPAIFDRSEFETLATLSGDQGARGLLASAPCVAAPAALLRDIDTPADLAATG